MLRRGGTLVGEAAYSNLTAVSRQARRCLKSAQRKPRIFAEHGRNGGVSHGIAASDGDADKEFPGDGSGLADMRSRLLRMRDTRIVAIMNCVPSCSVMGQMNSVTRTMIERRDIGIDLALSNVRSRTGIFTDGSYGRFACAGFEKEPGHRHPLTATEHARCGC
jgi:hypothetical protein